MLGGDSLCNGTYKPETVLFLEAKETEQGLSGNGMENQGCKISGRSSGQGRAMRLESEL